MEKIQYIVLYSIIKLHALLPMRALYVLSDVLFFWLYVVGRYRIGVVRRNMRGAFPEKSEKERRRTERAFYRHFCDYLVETLKLMHISERELQARARVTNPEFIDGLMEQGYSTFVVYMGHYGNWEWFSGSTSCFHRLKMFQIYRPLKNRAADRIFLELRTRFGAFCMAKQNTVREMVTLKQHKERALAIFLADQTPSRANIHYWSEFLNHDTPVYTGPERLAAKLNFPAVYMDVVKTRRGYYEGTFRMLAERPKELPEFELTERYIRLMEKTILRNPAYWLWTHKRWKHRREACAANETSPSPLLAEGK